MLRLETDRLILLPFTSTDLDFLHGLWTEPQVRRYLWDDLVISREQAQAVIEASQECFAEPGFGFWHVALKESETSIGFCGLRYFSDAQVDGNRIEILYGLTSAQWHKGLAVEAAQAVLRFGFEALRLEQIYAGADPPNAASFRVMERLGMHFDHVTELNGLTAHYYVITHADYLARQTLQ